MALSKEDLTYTQRLSRAIDAAFIAYKAGEPNGDTRLYGALRAQARNVIWWSHQRNDQALEHDIARRAITEIGTFRGKSKVSTWFYRVAKNEAFRALKAHIEQRNRMVPIDPVGEDDDEHRLERPVAKPTNQDAKLDLEVLCEGLPREQGEVVSRLAEGYSLKDYAKSAGLPLGTARSRYRLAKQKMARRARKRKPRW